MLNLLNPKSAEELFQKDLKQADREIRRYEDAISNHQKHIASRRAEKNVLMARVKGIDERIEAELAELKELVDDMTAVINLRQEYVKSNK
jgi:UDP-N-acetylglucosamine transferase subunit ALG13